MSLKSNSFTIHRPNRVRFFDNSQIRIGRKAIQNRAAIIYGKIDFDWYLKELSADKLRTDLKTALFKFPSLKTAASSSFSPGKHPVMASLFHPQPPTASTWTKSLPEDDYLLI